MNSLFLLAPLLIAAAEGASDADICQSGNSVCGGDECSDSHLKGMGKN